MAVIEIARIQVRRGQEKLTGIPQLQPGEFGWAEDTESLYIGKRIEEGASNNNNTRILTENDYANLFAIATGAGTTAVASTSTYRYRDNLSYNDMHSTVTSIGNKLDINISLVDYGVIPSVTATDITLQLGAAINDLFNNADLGADTRRRLIIPSGNYHVANPIALPPYTSIVGEGSGLTSLIATSNNGIFLTIDALGNTFEIGMQSSGYESKNISIEGLTLAFSSSTQAVNPLISLDNVSNAQLRDVRFTTDQVLTLTTYGTALRLRGQRISGIEQGRNVSIENCRFENIAYAINGTGTVVSINIENSVFTNLQQGINFSADPSDSSFSGPSNAAIVQNRFENIVAEGIYVGFSANRANHVSENNIFTQVGNGTGLNDFDGGYSPVITFFGDGCKSLNDTFSRRQAAYNSPYFYYFPLVQGNATLEDGSTYYRSIDLNNTTNIDVFPFTDFNQSLTVRYSLYDQYNYYSRSGQLVITANSNGDVSLSDYYDYSYLEPFVVTSGVNFGIVNLNTFTVGVITGIQVGMSIAGGGTGYNGNVAEINGNIITSTVNNLSTWNNSSLAFTGGWVGTGTNATGEVQHPEFSVSQGPNNQIVLSCDNTTSESYNIEYQISVLS